MIATQTIAAISTPPGTGAIAVVRVSGPDALAIADRIFSAQLPESTKGSVVAAREGWQSHLARHGYVYDPASLTVMDEVVLIPYRGPRTYTGEDLVEINCHGGSLVTREILDLCLREGARLARPGEFTERAFLSGRIDLTQAEAVLDLIQAKTSRQGRLALSALSGDLGQEISAIRKSLVELLTGIVAGIDFPEEVGDTPSDQVHDVTEDCLARLEVLSHTARSGRFLREGLRLAIVGRPNAGKSSLLNQLLKFERAIVTEVPGTTRDSLEELLDLSGIPVILIDTAGIRPTVDQVERIGIERTGRAINQSDLVLLVCDLSAGWGEPEEEICRLVGGRPLLCIGNKVDLTPDASVAGLGNHGCFSIGPLAISAKTGQGLPALTAAIESWVFEGDSARQGRSSLNARQAELCLKAVAALQLVRSTLKSGLPQDCLATDLKAAVDALSEISGEAVSEEVIHKVFANFCIGK